MKVAWEKTNLIMDRWKRIPFESAQPFHIEQVSIEEERLMADTDVLRSRRGFHSPPPEYEQSQLRGRKQSSTKGSTTDRLSSNAQQRHARARKRKHCRSEGDPFERYDDPCHETRDSLFSSTSGYTNYRGFLNLAILLLILSNARVAIENILKYGILIDPLLFFAIFIHEPYKWPNATLICGSSIFIIIAFQIERLLRKGTIGERSGVILQCINCFAVLFVPAASISVLKPYPFPSAICLGLHSVICLKLVSYAQVNRWCRNGLGGPVNFIVSDTYQLFDEKRQLIQYPSNLTLSNLLYFLCAPTLCYELNYPRTGRIRKWFLAKRLGEVLFLSSLITALSQQWIVPLLKNAVVPLVEMEYGRMVERLLKLSVPNIMLWLMFFYAVFHSLLNMIAEILRFGDRQFYKDWWNSESIQYFWQNWNIPVHRWATRHLYKPLVAAGYSRSKAAVSVFFVSAFFHEYLVSVPLFMFRWWAFSGMLAQVPLQHLTARVKSGKMGNMIVWMSLILGQPLCILMYLHDWYVLHYGRENTLEAASMASVMNETVNFSITNHVSSVPA